MEIFEKVYFIREELKNLRHTSVTLGSAISVETSQISLPQSQR